MAYDIATIGSFGGMGACCPPCAMGDAASDAGGDVADSILAAESLPDTIVREATTITPVRVAIGVAVLVGGFFLVRKLMKR